MKGLFPFENTENSAGCRLSRDAQMPNRAEGWLDLDRAASVSIERGHCYARVFTRVLAWNGKRHSPFMPCGVIEL